MALFGSFTWEVAPESLAVLRPRLEAAKDQRQSAVDWERARVEPGGVWLPWKRPATFRAAYAWLRRLAPEVPLGDWVVRAHLPGESPEPCALGTEAACAAPGPAVESGSADGAGPAGGHVPAPRAGQAGTHEAAGGGEPAAGHAPERVWRPKGSGAQALARNAAETPPEPPGFVTECRAAAAASADAVRETPARGVLLFAALRGRKLLAPRGLAWEAPLREGVKVGNGVFGDVWRVVRGSATYAVKEFRRGAPPRALRGLRPRGCRVPLCPRQRLVPCAPRRVLCPGLPLHGPQLARAIVVAGVGGKRGH